MIPFRFLLFLAVFALVVYLHFYLAHRQWRRLRGEVSAEIDPSYVRMEDYLAQSFRAKARLWLALPGETSPDGLERTIAKGRERIRVSGPRRLEAGERTGDILVVEGEFSCGPGCRLESEILASGPARIGAGSHLQAIAADGSLELGDSVQVARWADSLEELSLGAGCRLGARATATQAIRLGLGAQAKSLFASEVTTPEWDGAWDAPPEAEPPSRVEVPPPSESVEAPETVSEAGFDPRKMRRLSADTWFYNGAWKPPAPVHLRGKLVVRGDCEVAANSVLEGDLKAEGFLHLQSGAAAKGNLVAARSVWLAPGCRFSGVIHAGESILLQRGVRGIPRQLPAAAYAVERMFVEENVAVRGKLAAGETVEAVASADTTGLPKKLGFPARRPTA